jgi:hypothetical protein
MRSILGGSVSLKIPECDEPIGSDTTSAKLKSSVNSVSVLGGGQKDAAIVRDDYHFT